MLSDRERQTLDAHFARWVALWDATVDERHAPEKAELAELEATRIAGSISRRLRGQPTGPLTIRSQPSDQRSS